MRVLHFASACTPSAQRMQCNPFPRSPGISSLRRTVICSHSHPAELVPPQDSVTVVRCVPSIPPQISSPPKFARALFQWHPSPYPRRPIRPPGIRRYELTGDKYKFIRSEAQERFNESEECEVPPMNTDTGVGCLDPKTLKKMPDKREIQYKCRIQPLRVQDCSGARKKYHGCSLGNTIFRSCEVTHKWKQRAWSAPEEEV
ncbi:hypothetical protein K438DRAFT_1786233 [Mycena galopus ATCC 62051]|nr:hypothetical protein K438DRAFT_1786233 [Mycena galopus ATCC 62051]